MTRLPNGTSAEPTPPTPPGLMSRTWLVPAVVPSVRHNSEPEAFVIATKSHWLPNGVNEPAQLPNGGFRVARRWTLTPSVHQGSPSQMLPQTNRAIEPFPFSPPGSEDIDPVTRSRSRKVPDAVPL